MRECRYNGFFELAKPVLALFFVFGGVGQADAQSSCLTLHRDQAYAPFENSCPYGVEVVFTDEYQCAEYKCRLYVPAYAKIGTGGHFTGTVRWTACRSQGLGDARISLSNNRTRAYCME